MDREVKRKILQQYSTKELQQMLNEVRKAKKEAGKK